MKHLQYFFEPSETRKTYTYNIHQTCLLLTMKVTRSSSNGLRGEAVARGLDVRGIVALAVIANNHWSWSWMLHPRRRGSSSSMG
jgi:hypothetical protein